MAKPQRKYSLFLIAIILIAVLVAKWFKNTSVFNNHTDKTNNSWRYQTLEYTNHARCRMDCRHISQQEVEYILKGGQINYRKSDVHEVPCPTYAVEGNTDSGQHVRIVFGGCSGVTKVITCIDLENEFECNCN